MGLGPVLGGQKKHIEKSFKGLHEFAAPTFILLFLYMNKLSAFPHQDDEQCA
jgi:hypothetical protein